MNKVHGSKTPPEYGNEEIPYEAITAGVEGWEHGLCSDRPWKDRPSNSSTTSISNNIELFKQRSKVRPIERVHKVNIDGENQMLISP